jgi:hypothetical protein
MKLYVHECGFSAREETENPFQDYATTFNNNNKGPLYTQAPFSSLVQLNRVVVATEEKRIEEK